MWHTLEAEPTQLEPSAASDCWRTFITNVSHGAEILNLTVPLRPQKLVLKWE